jgi:hypothetical protein
MPIKNAEKILFINELYFIFINFYFFLEKKAKMSPLNPPEGGKSCCSGFSLPSGGLGGDNTGGA